jgi:transcriptional regulator with XRE-family HTH domain
MKLRSAEILKAFMKDQRLSMQGLATRANCSKSFVGFLANGAKTTCTPALAVRIAEALSVPLDVLFVDEASARSGRGDKSRRTAA